MYDELLSFETKFDLINETSKMVTQYFLNWKKQFPEDFQKFISENNIHIDSNGNLNNVIFKPFKIGYEIRVAQENIVAFSVVLDIFVKSDDSPICSYYCYYNDKGIMFDDFIEFE